MPSERDTWGHLGGTNQNWKGFFPNCRKTEGWQC